jgi:hypothetical protein
MGRSAPARCRASVAEPCVTALMGRFEPGHVRPHSGCGFAVQRAVRKTISSGVTSPLVCGSQPPSHADGRDELLSVTLILVMACSPSRVGRGKDESLRVTRIWVADRRAAAVQSRTARKGRAHQDYSHLRCGSAVSSQCKRKPVLSRVAIQQAGQVNEHPRQHEATGKLVRVWPSST